MSEEENKLKTYECFFKVELSPVREALSEDDFIDQLIEEYQFLHPNDIQRLQCWDEEEEDE